MTLSATDLASTRPTRHLTAAAGWLNDPVGVAEHGGRHHLFFQYVPGSTDWEVGCHWGHASSDDLETWTEHEPALAPGDGDDGCWSGRLLLDGDDATVYYTSVTTPGIQLGVVREARPLDDDWLRWHKGPVVVRPPEGLDLFAFRDPSVFRDGEVWRMLVGAGHADGAALVLSFSSSDRVTWEYDGPLATRTPSEHGGGFGRLVWECPHLVEVGDHHVLVASLWGDDETQYVEASVGTYRDGTFHGGEWTRIGYGHGHYAPTPFTGPQGETGLFFWIRGVGDPADGWAGAISAPYLLSVVDGRVALDPLRTGRDRVEGSEVARWLTSNGGDGDLVIFGPDGSPVASVVADGPDLIVEAGGAPVRVPRGPGAVSALLDGSVLEVCTGTALVGLPLVPGG